ncbi:MAG: aminotransferase class V-fold PLP-dependent enzyme [Oscillospiraceae bacterium]|nr:aminotransferase class V-fold PLP-dependent enzyme [Oscillospiraceae bacterium]
MNTPICDFVRSYAAKDPLRLHMPGHKGRPVLGPEALDITEVEGADVLYHARGIIRESEENAASLFGTAATFYSTEGSSLCIRAMLYLALLQAKEEGREPLILAGRNAHKTFLSAIALLDLEVEWLYPSQEAGLLSCPVEPAQLEAAFAGERKPTAVYVTAPDYLGNLLDIRALAELCHRHGALLLVDNAHGAYLHFLPQPIHPMDLGADLCCDSAHKTLPVLTGGAYLHISRTAPAGLKGQGENALSLFASTSPSYLILQSLDRVNLYLWEKFPTQLKSFLGDLSVLKGELKGRNYPLVGQEPLKLTIASKPLGYNGQDLAKHLQSVEIEPEFADPDFLVLMLTPEIGKQGLERLQKSLEALSHRPSLSQRPPALPRPRRIMTPRQALLSPQEEIPVSQCFGRILASAAVSCPPAIPILICGEQIDCSAMDCFQYYGIERCAVVKQ